MSQAGVFYDLLSTVFDRRFSFRRMEDDRTIEALCLDLLTSKGEITANKLGQLILDRFDTLDDEAVRAFFAFITENLDVDPDAIVAATEAYRANPDAENLETLLAQAEPRRQTLLRRINQVPGATVRLVRMRERLLEFAREDATFKRADLDFQHLFRSWFNRGFLVLRRIDWQSPASILQKIIQYEAVHEIDDWDDLRRRVEPEDRRCYAFFHPSMPDDPLIFVEVALYDAVPSSVQAILASERTVLEPENANMAVFYSISNCQKGLKGISFGNSLIKQVAHDLIVELPHFKTFVTLSPLPKFAKWLDADEIDGDAFDDETLKRKAAAYLCTAKNEDGFPVDPVARFHLNNGASVYKVHAGADLSSNGMKQSHGVMVNYLYDLDVVGQNHENYASKQVVSQSKEIAGLVARSKKSTAE